MDSKLYFKEVANQWDNMREEFFTEEVRDKAYEVAEVKNGELAADIGAGTGFITEGLLKKGLKVIAVDRSEEMLEEIKKKFNSFGDVECRQGEAEKLPVESEAVDYAMANMFLHHVEEPLATIKEMVRIIRPGGKLVVTDLDEHKFDFLVTEQHDRWMGFDRKAIENWFIEAGLKNVFVDCVGGNCCAASSCGCEKASISIFVAYGEK
ncbi:class I SAM-dependent methyltransferase [Clostridium sp. C8-1-8]|uniref:class I SAM-dependent methyltransferase n=1 Tax=Clostridium sp. C8-1-8 TaxID=2698831 RepID=UPI00136B88AE|nr:class I SAM-dependent methyltransferase [Clostridium sp. C8-1-8]